MSSCARPGCSEPIAGSLLLHRADRIAELLPLGDPLGVRYGVGLCGGHLGRAKAPNGWELIDRLTPAAPASATPAPAPPTRPMVHGAPGSATNPARPVWIPGRSSDTEDLSELATATSPLLRRAFRGDVTHEGQIEGQQRLRV